MSRRTGILALITVIFLVAGVAPALAQPVTEHHLIRPFPGAVLNERSSVHQNFDSYDFQVRNPQTGRADTRTVKGEYRRLLYYLYREDGSRNTSVSRVEYFENFKAAALAKNSEVKTVFFSITTRPLCSRPPTNSSRKC